MMFFCAEINFYYGIYFGNLPEAEYGKTVENGWRRGYGKMEVAEYMKGRNMAKLWKTDGTEAMEKWRLLNT
jgi:hypothetical protein